jgi:hypothetical protein
MRIIDLEGMGKNLRGVGRVEWSEFRELIDVIQIRGTINEH